MTNTKIPNVIVRARIETNRKRINTIESELHELAAEIARLEEERRVREAERAGLAYELQLLETGMSVRSIAELDRTEAIIAILRQSSAPLSPAQIVDGLKAAGRTEEHARSVSATLDHLKKRGSVRSERRGQWTVTG